jgi:carboxyl-terminal processing protease
MEKRSRSIAAAAAALLLVGTAFGSGYLVAGSDDGDGIALRGSDSGGSRIVLDGEIEPGEGAGILGEALNEIRASSVDPPSEQDLVRGAIRGMVKILKKNSDDPYALFYTPRAYDDFQELSNGEFSGIGVWLKEKKQDYVIISVLPSTPAVEAGLEPGDIIRTVDGKPVSTMSADEAVNRIKGPEGTDVTLGIERGAAQLEFTITRASIDLPNLEAEVTEDGFGYIRLFGFARGAGTQVREEIEAMIGQGVDGVILDVRDNGGGLFTEAIEVASVFIESGDVVIYRERSSNEIVYEAEGDAFQDVKLVVLVNEGTASASEIVAGAVQDNERGVVVGTSTYGKGSVQQIVPLVDSSAIKLTTAAYLTPEGRDIDGEGIEPDVEVEEASLQRQRAVEILRGIVASAPGG